MNLLKKLADLLPRSSEDVNQVSLTVRSGIPLLLLLGTTIGVDLDKLGLNEAADALAQVLLGLGLVVSASGTLYGFVRRVKNTLKK